MIQMLSWVPRALASAPAQSAPSGIPPKLTRPEQVETRPRSSRGV